MLTTLSHLPRLSLFDPPEASEGSIDPLGLAMLADRLAGKFVPGYTERSRRLRFLTALALGARVLSRPQYPDGVYGDHPDGPAYLGFERLLLEAFGHKGKKGDAALLRIPGIGKAREAAEAGARLSSSLYLKGPAAVGLWAAYKRLARDLEILDDDGHLLENGFRLLTAWEEGIGQRGLVTGVGSESQAVLADMDRALAPLLGEAASPSNPQRTWTLLHANLLPGSVTPPERKVIRSLLTELSNRRSEVFQAVRDEWQTKRDLDDFPERDVLVCIQARVGPELRDLVSTILAYEDLVVRLRFGFNCILFVGGRRSDGRVDFEAVLGDATVGSSFRDTVATLSSTLEPTEAKLHTCGETELAHETLFWLHEGALASPEAFFESLVLRHQTTQRKKPPDGKRSWIEGTPEDHYVRTHYARSEPPPEEITFHGYRTSPVRQTIKDFWEPQSGAK